MDFEKLAQSVFAGDDTRTCTLCELLLAEGETPARILNEGLVQGLTLAGEGMEKGEWHYHDADGRFWAPAPGMAVFDIATSFAMIRSGHLISIMGALQVSEKGDLANWNPGGGTLGGTIGGGMDLTWGAERVINLPRGMLALSKSCHL